MYVERLPDRVGECWVFCHVMLFSFCVHKNQQSSRQRVFQSNYGYLRSVTLSLADATSIGGSTAHTAFVCSSLDRRLYSFRGHFLPPTTSTFPVAVLFAPEHAVRLQHMQAIRDMVDGGNSLPGSVGRPTNGDGDTDDHDRHARAAQVLAAVVSGLTSTPKELSSKHRANRSAAASASGTGSGAGASAAAAKPAVQKIRDYQLQVTLTP